MRAESQGRITPDRQRSPVQRLLLPELSLFTGTASTDLQDE